MPVELEGAETKLTLVVLSNRHFPREQIPCLANVVIAHLDLPALRVRALRLDVQDKELDLAILHFGFITFVPTFRADPFAHQVLLNIWHLTSHALDPLACILKPLCWNLLLVVSPSYGLRMLQDEP